MGDSSSKGGDIIVYVTLDGKIIQKEVIKTDETHYLKTGKKLFNK